MPRSKFDRELKKISRDLGAMSKLVQGNLDDSMKALINRDIELASKVKELDKEKIDLIFRDVEERCIQCIALHQPVAGDLRFISTAMSVGANLERIGDYAKDVAMIVPFILKDPRLDEEEKMLEKMCENTKIMTKEAVSSFINKNKNKVNKVNKYEEEVDEIYGSIFPKFKERVAISCGNAPLVLNLLLVARYLERAADHAMNISQRTIYVINGAWKDME